MTLEQALDIVAQKVAADHADSMFDGWDSYPEIGEHDWHEVVVRANALTLHPDRAAYDEAYALLEARANREEL